MSSGQEPKPTTRKKPVKGYYVQSRYKQAAEASSQSSSSREKSPHTTMARGHSKQQSSLEQSTLRFHRDGDTCNPKASTPAIQGRLPLPAIETSSIDASGFLRVPVGMNKTRSRAGPSKSKDNTLSVTEYNILYAQYLQAKFLESSALETLEKRSENGVEQLYLAWNYVQKLLIKNAAVERELSLVNHLIRLHKHLNKQEKMLLPVLDIIPKLESQYESIAKAVDIVRHKLEVRNMSLPPDRESEEEVMEWLSKISNLIQSLKSMQDSKEVIKCSAVSETFSQYGNLVVKEIERAETLLTEMNSLLVDESAYKLLSEDY